MTTAVEAKHPRDLPKLVEAMRRLNIEDPNLIITINQESGETLMAGMGVSLIAAEQGAGPGSPPATSRARRARPE